MRLRRYVQTSLSELTICIPLIAVMGLVKYLLRMGIDMDIGSVLNDRYASIEANSTNVVPSTSIELPVCITELITGNEYWRKAKANRYKKLVREGHLSGLLRLAEIAKTKGNPANWFATVCSVKQWERTLEYLSKLREVAQTVADVAKRVFARPNQMKAVYKACWRSKDALRHAITAQETGRDVFKYFCWLVWKGERGQC